MTMQNLDKVSDLRAKLNNKNSGIKNVLTKSPGVYRWWFKESCINNILSSLPLTTDEINKIQKDVINGETYYALYFGISKDMFGRAKWHIVQKHTQSSVNHGALSTLRQTLSALLNKDMSAAESCVNQFMDNNCYWEWEYDNNPKSKEIAELTSKYVCYPLNIKENKTVNKDVLNGLKKLRKEYKK